MVHLDMEGKHRYLWPVLLLIVAAGTTVTGGLAQGAEVECRPTEADALGPFYKPGAPVRGAVGSGYVLSGTVRSAVDCSPVPGARIEFWLAGPAGDYADDFRATVVAAQDGAYRFESDFPPPYAWRPSHIHIRVSAEGFATLVTQHYPEKGKNGAVFDLVLLPAP